MYVYLCVYVCVVTYSISIGCFTFEMESFSFTVYTGCAEQLYIWGRTGNQRTKYIQKDKIIGFVNNLNPCVLQVSIDFHLPYS